MTKIWLISLGILMLSAQAHATSPRSIDSVINTVFATHQFREVGMSPSGNSVAWIESWPLNESTYQNKLFVEDLESHHLTAITAEASKNV